MPRPLKRPERIHLRLTKIQRGTIEERAAAEGLTMTEYIVLAACGDLAGSEVRPERTPDFERRVREEMRTMPKGNAERVVRREEARERAKAALAGTR